MPSAEKIERIDEKPMSVVVKQAVSSVCLKFRGRNILTGVNPSIRIEFKGDGI